MRLTAAFVLVGLIMAIGAGCSSGVDSSSGAPDTAPPTTLDLRSVVAADLPTDYREIAKGGLS